MTGAETQTEAASFSDAAMACALFAIDPAGLGGILVRGPADTAREAVLNALAALMDTAPLTIPANVTPAHMLGEEDGLASLANTASRQPLLARADGGVVLLPGAERRDTATLFPILAAIDTGMIDTPRGPAPARFGVIALDDGRDDERAPASLTDRLAFAIAPAGPIEVPDITFITALRSVTVPDAIIDALCAASVAYGVHSIRAGVFAVRAARASAALAGRTETTQADAQLAARLVLGPRATQIPSTPAEDDAPPPDRPPEAPSETETPPEAAAAPPPPDAASPDQQPAETPPSLEDLVVAATLATVPPEILTRPPGQVAAKPRGRGAGDLAKASGRGRPSGSRRRPPRPGDRLALADTLRAAAPWQRVRDAPPGRIAVRPDDLHVRRLRSRVTATTIFVVDASGSAARQRLNEAKGAVEALLAACYVRRDEVALVSFRDTAAEILVPPTRSLTRAKRLLAALPGGGPTPLAAGLACAHDLADSVRRRGGSPFLVVLTDGRGNIARDGAPGRPRAMADAETAARAIALARHPGVLIDTAPRPQPAAQALAGALAARYIALPAAAPTAMANAIMKARPDA